MTAVPNETSEGLTRCMRIDAGLYQKTRVTDLLSRVKNPAVATAAFCDPFPTVTPASAATPQSVGPCADAGPAGAAAAANGAGGKLPVTADVVPGRSSGPHSRASTPRATAGVASSSARDGTGAIGASGIAGAALELDASAASTARAAFCRRPRLSRRLRRWTRRAGVGGGSTSPTASATAASGDAIMSGSTAGWRNSAIEDVTTSSTLATANASAPSTGATTIGARRRARRGRVAALVEQTRRPASSTRRTRNAAGNEHGVGRPARRATRASSARPRAPWPSPWR